MATPTEHRSKAEALLEKAQGYAPSAAARIAVLAEAQVHATLALSPAETPEANATLEAAAPQEDLAPVKQTVRRSRKAAPAKEEAK